MRLGRGSLALASLLLAVTPLATVAQDASPTTAVSPAPGSPQVAASSAPGELAFPATVAETTLAPQTYDGTEWLAGFADGTDGNEAFVTDVTAWLESIGKTPADVTVKSALQEVSEGNNVVILGMQIADTDAHDWVTDAVTLLLGDIVDPQFLLRPMDTRWVLRVQDAAVPGVYPRTVYVDGDTAWMMGGDEGYVSEMVGQLPISAPAVAADEPSLASMVPNVLDGRRRAGLYESREPTFMPTLEWGLSAVGDSWLLDLYLENGLTPADLMGAIAWWGVGSSEESVEIEGYQVPGASPELMDDFLQSVFLAAGGSLPDEVGRTEEELGGRTVTSIDFDYQVQHIFGSGDTIWVVTDHAKEPDMAAAAIAALP